MGPRFKATDRKQVIAEAVLAITARHGLDTVSVRDVAAEAGVSVGSVQHYFRTKDEMLLFACRYMIERGQARTQALLTSLPAPRSVQSVLRELFAQMLPLTEERRTAIRVWIAFLARATVEPELEAFMRQTYMNTHRLIATQIHQAQNTGEVRESIDVERTTRAVLMLVDGLVSHVQIGHYTGAEAMQAVDDHLAEIFRSTA